MIRLTRVYRFSASHRLHAANLSREDNFALYGKCNNPFGHGHNYIVHVSVSGGIDALTGRLVDIGMLDRYVHERVVDCFDHRDMNRDIDDFTSVVPTTENLAIAIDRRLRDGWGERFETARLERVLIEETPRNTFELRAP
jgi:6-pyruvoyltetrahydropterin/6-carboxytetrahydropterin synthase